MKLKGVELFRVGTWSGSRKVVATSEMLDQMVSNFAELNKAVPGFGVAVKLGHNNRIGEPAYGWATDVYREGDVMLGDFADVEPQLVDRIQKRQYNSVSIELYPVVQYADKTFHNVLAGVALLGAEWPAVKGLKPLSEAESLFSAEAEKLDFNYEDPMPFSQEQLDAAVGAARTEMQGTIDSITAERDTALAALAAFRKETQTAAFSAAIDTAIAAGKLLPKAKDAYVALAANFAGKTDKVKMGDKEVTPLEAFQSILDGLPTAVQFGEKGESDSKKPAEGSKASERVAASARALMAKDNKLSFGDAAQMVFAADPELKLEYAQENA